MTNWAVRTVRNGAVKIDGKLYRPQEHHRKYDGRLDGHRFAFARYLTPEKTYEPFVALWGTEHDFRSDEWDGSGAGPHLVDGGYPWQWWAAEDRARGVDA